MAYDPDENWFAWLCEEKDVRPWAEMMKLRKSASAYSHMRKPLSPQLKFLMDARKHFGVSWEKLGKLLDKQYEREQE